MTVQNIVILYGNEEQIMQIQNSHAFRGAKTNVWNKSSKGKGYTTNFVTDFEMPNYRLKDISLDYPEVKINYYYFSDKKNEFILGYKKVKEGIMLDKLFWSSGDKNKGDARNDAFAKRFFLNCCPYQYNKFFSTQAFGQIA